MLEMVGAILRDAWFQLLAELVDRYVAGPVSWMLQAFGSAGLLQNLWTTPWARYLITFSQSLAATVLAVRISWEAWQHYIVRVSGGGGDAAAFVTRVFTATAGVAATPWLAQQALILGNTLARDVAAAPFGSALRDFGANWAAMFSQLSGAIWVPVLMLAGCVLLTLIFMQAMIRTIEMFLLGVLGPVLAVGWVSPNEGTAAAWWRELLVVASSHAVQLLLLYVTAALLVGPIVEPFHLYLRPFLALGALWVTWRTPVVLRTFAYHTGVAGAIAQASHTATSALAFRVLARLPA